MLKYYIFGLHCIINSCLCISFAVCECVDIHPVCARHLQEGAKKPRSHKTFFLSVKSVTEKQSTAFNPQPLLLHDYSPSL